MQGGFHLYIAPSVNSCRTHPLLPGGRLQTIEGNTNQEASRNDERPGAFGVKRASPPSPEPMAAVRRTPKPKGTKAPLPKGATVDLPPMAAPRGEAAGNLRARAEHFQKRRGNSKA